MISLMAFRRSFLTASGLNFTDRFFYKNQKGGIRVGRQSLLTSEEFYEWIQNRELKIKNASKEKTESKIKKKLENIDKAEIARTTYYILGIKNHKDDVEIEEFEKSGICLKTIRITNDNKIIEKMSFPAFEFKELMEEEWELSQCYELLCSKTFFFVVYQEMEKNNFVLKGAKSWNMPSEDCDIAYKGWDDIRATIHEGVKFKVVKNGEKEIVYNNFPDSKNSRDDCPDYLVKSTYKYNDIVSIRPHASLSYYDLKSIGYKKTSRIKDKKEIAISPTNGSELPNGDIMTKQCFWLNNHYVYKQVSDLLDEKYETIEGVDYKIAAKKTNE